MLSPFVVHPSFIYEFALLGARGTDRDSAAAAYRAIRTGSDARGFCRVYGWWYFLPTPPDSPMVSNEAWRRFCDAPGEQLLQGEAVKRAMLRSLGYWSWRTGVNSVKAPVLVIEGHGPDVVDDAARRWAEHLPHARVLRLAPPHLFPWLGDPVAFRKAAEQLLDGGWPAGSEQPPPFDQSVASEPQR